MSDQNFDLDDVIRHVNDGDESAFRKLYDQYYGRVFQVAEIFLKDDQLAEEVTTEVFSILDKIETLVPEEFEKMYTGIARSVVLAKLKGLPTEDCWRLHDLPGDENHSTVKI